jgi:hypothetical protein
MIPASRGGTNIQNTAHASNVKTSILAQNITAFITIHASHAGTNILN